MKIKYETPEMDLVTRLASDVIQTSGDRGFQYESRNITYQSGNEGSKLKLW